MTAHGAPDDPNLSNRPPHESWPMPAFVQPPQYVPQQPSYTPAPQPQYHPQYVGPQPTQTPAQPPQQYAPQPQQQYAPPQQVPINAPDVTAVANAVNARLKRLADFEALQAELAHAIGEADLAQRRVVRIARLIAAFDEEDQRPSASEPQQSHQSNQPIAGQYVEPQYAQEPPPPEPRWPQPAPEVEIDEDEISLLKLPGLNQSVASALVKYGVRSIGDVRATIKRIAKSKEKIPGIGPAYLKALDAALTRWDRGRQR